MHGRSLTTAGKDQRDTVPDRWPHIRRYLRVGEATVDDDFIGWAWRAEDRLSRAALAVGYEEWADFFEWRLELSVEEHAGDGVQRHRVAEWTEGIVYCCRRSAARARGEDPGEWVPQHQRRPDLASMKCAIVAETTVDA